MDNLNISDSQYVESCVELVNDFSTRGISTHEIATEMTDEELSGYFDYLATKYPEVAPFLRSGARRLERKMGLPLFFECERGNLWPHEILVRAERLLQEGK